MQVPVSKEGCPERASCPVCGGEVVFADINSHIDKCLRHKEASQQPAATGSSVEGPPVTKTPAPSSRGKQSLLSGYRKREPSSGTASSGPGKKRKLSFATSPTSIGTVIHSSNALHHSSSQSATVSSSHTSSWRSQHPSASLASPLSDLVRPATLTDYMGQEEVVGKNSLLRTAVESGHTPSLIFWGPPGCGKTTLARILVQAAQQKMGARCVQLSASSCGVGEVKETVKIARNDKVMFKRQTVLFIDEIHQFNKLQQDTFLPHVEDGTITLLGATTENPSFKLNSALLSRCKVIVLKKLQPKDVQRILRNAMRQLVGIEQPVRGKEGEEEERPVVVEDDAISLLSEMCDGDARRALNALQMAVETAKNRQLHSQQSDSETPTDMCSQQVQVQVQVTVSDAKESMQCSYLLYDRAGDQHYNCISALHKSMRGSDATAALYWLARMLCAGEDPLYVARRIVRFASEDVGLAEPAALQLAVSAYHACQAIGMPECELALAQAVVFMARAPKSVEVYKAYSRAVACIKDHRGPQPCVPLHLCNAPTQMMKEFGYGRGYQYNPDCEEPVEQLYMPVCLRDENFFRQC